MTYSLESLGGYTAETVLSGNSMYPIVLRQVVRCIVLNRLEVVQLKQCYQVSDNVSYSIASGGLTYSLESLGGYTAETGYQVSDNVSYNIVPVWCDI